MRAGLLADIILGESPYLRGLVKHYSFLVLDQAGKITGFNTHFAKNTGKTEEQIINQSFAKFFDSDEGKVELQYSVKQALKGTPTVVNFHLGDGRIYFKGVILPVYDKGHEPASIIVIAREEHKPVVEEHELEDFWRVAQELIAEAGIAPANDEKAVSTRMRKPKILLVEDKGGLVNQVFKRLLQKPSKDILLISKSEEGVKAGVEFGPDVVVSVPDLESSFETRLKATLEASIIHITAIGTELRIEDGWLDIRVKNQADSMTKILELIHQLYW